MHRANLHEVLRHHGYEVPVRMGVAVRRLTQQNGTVAVELSDGTAASYDLVVGADGVHSTVRRLVVDAGAARPVGQLAWRFVIGCPVEVTTWTVLLGQGVTFLAVPIGCGRAYCHCDTSAARPPRPAEGDATRLRKLLAGFGGPVPGILGTLDADTAVHVAPPRT
jgi:2-polyprenyl-6-methoxyphenol hydroxylase-like FAD-dependent oxidoreductase